MKWQGKIQKIGKRFAVIILPEVIEKLGWDEHTLLDVVSTPKGISVTKIKSSKR